MLSEKFRLLEENISDPLVQQIVYLVIERILGINDVNTINPNEAIQRPGRLAFSNYVDSNILDNCPKDKEIERGYYRHNDLWDKLRGRTLSVRVFAAEISPGSDHFAIVKVTVDNVNPFQNTECLIYVEVFLPMGKKKKTKFCLTWSLKSLRAAPCHSNTKNYKNLSSVKHF